MLVGSVPRIRWWRCYLSPTLPIVLPYCLRWYFQEHHQWDDFVENIGKAKSAFEYVSALDTFYKNNIVKLAATKDDDKEVEKHCLICNETYKVTANNGYRYLCESCAHKYYFPLKQSRSAKGIKELILSLNKVIHSTDQLMDKLIEIANGS